MGGAGGLTRLLRLVPALAGLMLAGAASATPDRCEDLRRIGIPGVTIEIAKRLSGNFTTSDGAKLVLTPLCRVRGVARPTPASHITFELWMPVRGWNGRYYQLGNGGFAGNLHLPSLAAEAARGNAAAVTDTGHTGDGFDARWAAGQPERVVDYGYRSIKVTSDAVRALIAAYYGRPPTRRYFAGCSNGGRQALVAARRYPADWDGIIAGAPAAMWTSQLASFAAIQHRLRAIPDAWIAPAKLPAIQRAALASCRPDASVLDGVAGDPRLCPFDPARLACRGAASATCLTLPQIISLRLIMRAGFEPTSAAVLQNWDRWIVNPDPAAPSQLTFATQGFRHLIRDRPGWTVADYDPRQDAASGELRGTVDASVDFDRFRARGGKIISYFGWADAVISPRIGVDYYRRVAARAGGASRTQQFYRLFMVPGMTHCQGGPGPDSFGQSIPAPALRGDPRHDIRRALEAWVERGVAPDELVAARYVDGDPAKGVAATRVLRPLR